MKNYLLELFLLLATLGINAQNTIPTQSSLVNPANNNVQAKPQTKEQVAIPLRAIEQGADRYQLEQGYSLKRIEQERKTLQLMEDYRSELFLRIIKDEFYRLNSTNQQATPPDSPDGNLALAKYKILKELAFEQRAQKAQPNLHNTNQAVMPPYR